MGQMEYEAGKSYETWEPNNWLIGPLTRWLLGETTYYLYHFYSIHLSNIDLHLPPTADS
jgi:hypothetical protein